MSHRSPARKQAREDRDYFFHCFDRATGGCHRITKLVHPCRHLQTWAKVSPKPDGLFDDAILLFNSGKPSSERS